MQVKFYFLVNFSDYMNYKFVTIRRIICFVFFDLATNIGLLRDGGDSYNEELFIKRLKSENILSQFRFIITTRINLGKFLFFFRNFDKLNCNLFISIIKK